MTEFIIVSLIILAASAYLVHLSWRCLRHWLGRPAAAQAPKPSRPQSITFNGKPLR
ncbi:MAG: hypothetical protein V3U29_06140 [Phycisphaeraceae bacterium]